MTDGNGANREQWKCNHFALTLDEDEVPEVLRRVAGVIDETPGFSLLSMIVHPCAGEATAFVAYSVRE